VLACGAMSTPGVGENMGDDQFERAPPLYEHSAPKLGSYGLLSFVFYGGGQLAKGQLRRFVALWAILIVWLGGTGGCTFLIDRESAARVVFAWLAGGGVLALWIYQVLDALLRPK
jgi:hypothetical protein